MSAIFDRKLRFNNNYPEWVVEPLSEIFAKITHRNTDNNIVNVVTNSAEYGLIPQSEYFDKEIANNENTSNYYVIEKGDFVYNPRKSTSAPYGPFNCYFADKAGIISPLYTALRLKKAYNPEYLAWYFKSHAWYRYIYDNGSQGVRHDRVSMTDELLFGIPILVPCIDEQIHIANFLNKIEKQLNIAEEQLNLYMACKTNLLSKMFI